MASASFWVQLRLDWLVRCDYAGEGCVGAQTHPCKALTGQRVRIRGGFSALVSPVSLILHLPALPQNPQHRCYIAQALIKPRVLGLTPHLCCPEANPWEMHNPSELTDPALPLSQNKERCFSKNNSNNNNNNKKQPPKKAVLELSLFLCLFR